MRFSSFNQDYLLKNNPYMNIGVNGRNHTAGAIAKQMVSDIDFSKGLTNDKVQKHINQINNRVKNLHQSRVRYSNYRLNNSSAKELAEHTQNIAGLLHSADSLRLNGKNSVFKDSGIINSNKSVAEVSSNKRVSGNRGFDLKVDNVATAQSNAFATVNDVTGKASEDSGFTIKKGEKSFNFNVSAVDPATNKPMTKLDSLNKLADAVNNSKIGIKAVVEKSADGKSAALKLSSEATGKKNAFSISDEKGLTSSNKELQKAENASFEIKYGNGYSKKLESDKNSVELFYEGVKLKLKEKGEANIKFDGLNKEKVSKGVNDLVEKLNNVNDKLMENDRKKPVAAADNKFKHIHKELENIGIKYDEKKGKFSVDKAALDKAMDNPDKFKEALGGTGKIADKIKNISNTALKDITKRNRIQNTNSIDKELNDILNKNLEKLRSRSRSNSDWNRLQTFLQMHNSYGFNINKLFGSPFMSR